ncbi:DNA-3-methyladenine glycosylase 1 [Muribaculaceae bacterium]|nr:DNA-3-methyladenine glycosylase 1 [Muribaculaceae bacterium]GFI56848.1 DNA-3-methyladenine glycosylase 1 [Muribaculaceae bacterium]
MTDRKKNVNRCFWVNPKNPLYIKYHDEEWGRPVHDDRQLLELLILESFQAGLSWECVLNKREAFREAFDGFDRDSILSFDEKKIDELMACSGIIRNRAKIKSAISNTVVFKTIQEEFGSFDSYLSGFCPKETIMDHTSTTSAISDTLSADLRKRGMKFVGSTTIHAFLQSIGVFNSHQPDCFLYHKNSDHDRAD